MNRTAMKPGKGFKRPERPPRVPVVYQPLQVTPNYEGATTGPMAKGVKARPGKRTQTVEEQRWIEAIVAHGCIACWLDGVPSVPSCVHHILRGSMRLGHLFSLPLCPGHHQDGTGAPGMIARHPHKSRFEKKYGSELTLLNGLQRKLGFPLLEFK